MKRWTPGPSVFVGREAELAQLRAGLERALNDRGGMFLLKGEPGIGKTRLAEELVYEASRQPFAVFWGRCTQAEGAPPYWPWVQILRTLLRDLGQAELARIAGPGLAQLLHIVPELRIHFPDVVSTPTDDDATRFRTYDAITQLLLKAATVQPIVFVLEDLHWADVPSLLLLQLLAGAVTHSALMVIGTYRDRELPPEHPLRAQAGDFIRRGETIEIAVGGLADKEVAGLLRALMAFEPADDVVRRLQSQTAGNPFFLKELARSLGEEADEVSPGRFARSIDVVPQGVGAVLRRHIETLSAECRRVLEVAAVAGQELDLELLVAAGETLRPQLLDLLDTAIASGVVTRRDGAYAFAHGLVRDTVYAGISSVRRGELHGRVGRVLEERPFGEFNSSLAPLAHHFIEASLVDESLRSKALEYAVAAGRRARTELAYEEAVRLFELALGKAAPPDPAARAELLLDVGRVRYLAGDIGGAVEAAEEVSRLAEKLDDASLMARAALVVSGVGGPGLSHRIVHLCREAMRRPINDGALKIQLLSQMTVALMQTGNAADELAAKEASREAVELAKDAVDPDVVFAGIHARQMATSGPDGVDERLELAERTIALAREAGRSSMAQWGHTWRLDALVQLGRIDEAEVEVAVQAKLADQLHEPLARWRALQAQSWLMLLRGRFAEAQALAEEARQLGRKGHHAPAEFIYLTHGVVAAAFLGGMDAAYAAIEELVSRLPNYPPSPIFESGAFALSGRLDEARAALRQVAATGFENAGPIVAWLPSVALVIEAIAAVGDADLAQTVYEATLPFARLNVSAGGSGLYGSVSRYLGMLATTLGRWDDASMHFEDGIELEGRMTAPPFLARSRIAYAEMLIKRGRDADLHRARPLLDAALAASRELGMKPWEERASMLISALAARGVADHPLSSREMEVAVLVAEGLSNREIATRLHLSERTAESHVKNICDKLGFNSRSQVAVWVATRKRE